MASTGILPKRVNSLPQNNIVLPSSKMPLAKRKMIKMAAEAQRSKTCVDIKSEKKKGVRKIPPRCVYLYKVYPGNNGRIVLGALRKRSWWHGSAALTADSPEQHDDSSLSFIWEMYKSPFRYRSSVYDNCLINHLEHNGCLVTKKGLYFCIRDYCAANRIDMLGVIPLTYYLSSTGSEGTTDDTQLFLDYNEQRLSAISCSASVAAADESFDSTSGSEGVPETKSTESKTNSQGSSSSAGGLIWILKPASKTNRGFGITVVRGVPEVMAIVQQPPKYKKNKGSAAAYVGDPIEDKDVSLAGLERIAQKRAAQNGWIVQEYMERPLLVSGRKFDIRCFVVVTQHSRDGVRAYWYSQAYIRTSCKKYSLKNIHDRETHLTNDAIQKNSKSYGKFESGNKQSLDDLQECISNDYGSTYPNHEGCVLRDIYPKMKQLAAISVSAAKAKISSTKCKKSFELLGYDFMVNDAFEPTLIEINSNPSLEICCPLIADLIPTMIHNMVRVCLDPVFRPPPSSSRTKSCQECVDLIATETNRFEPLDI